MFRRYIKIKHPDWLKVSKPQGSIDLYLKGLLPDKIAGGMIVIGLKHPLRAVYGSDLRAAIALLYQATFRHWWEETSLRWWALTHRKEVEEIENDTNDDLLREMVTKVLNMPKKDGE